MNTRISTTDELKQIFIESLINSTDKVSKVSPGSVLNGIAYSVAKIGQKAIREISLVEARKFSSFAYGGYLDEVAKEMGVPARFSGSKSSVYVFVSADSGTIYNKSDVTFKSSSGISFEMEDDSFTISDHGFAYLKLRSVSTGLKASVDPMSINEAVNAPSGHKYVINEYMATGGSDSESDDMFRSRIRDSFNIAARGTLSSITQALMVINSNVLRVINYGQSGSGKTRLCIISSNGVDFTSDELSDMMSRSDEYLSLSDMRPYGMNVFGVELTNPVWFSIDIDFRCKMMPAYNVDSVRKNMQVKISKYMDYRYWDSSKRVEWDDLLAIVKSTTGVEYIPDNNFSPRVDISIPRNSLPRPRSFTMRDLSGSIISDVSGNFSPVYFPNDIDKRFGSIILNNI